MILYCIAPQYDIALSGKMTSHCPVDHEYIDSCSPAQYRTAHAVPQHNQHNERAISQLGVHDDSNVLSGQIPYCILHFILHIALNIAYCTSYCTLHFTYLHIAYCTFIPHTAFNIACCTSYCISHYQYPRCPHQSNRSPPPGELCLDM